MHWAQGKFADVYRAEVRARDQLETEAHAALSAAQRTQEVERAAQHLAAELHAAATSERSEAAETQRARNVEEQAAIAIRRERARLEEVLEQTLESWLRHTEREWEELSRRI